MTWANSAYLALTEAKSDGETLWPLPLLIDVSGRPAAGLRYRLYAIEGDRRVLVAERWLLPG